MVGVIGVDIDVASLTPGCVFVTQAPNSHPLGTPWHPLEPKADHPATISSTNCTDNTPCPAGRSSSTAAPCSFHSCGVSTRSCNLYTLTACSIEQSPTAHEHDSTVLSGEGDLQLLQPRHPMSGRNDLRWRKSAQSPHAFSLPPFLSSSFLSLSLSSMPSL